MLKRIDKVTCGMLASEIKEALKGIEKKHGVTIQMSGGKYTELSYSPKLEVKVNETSDGISGERAEFNRYCYQYGLTPEDYGKTIETGGKRFTFVGFRPRRPKFPIVMKDEQGKLTLFTEFVVHMIKK